MFTSRLGINPVATPVMRFMKTTIETGSDTFPSTAAAAGMVSKTGNTSVVSDNTVTTLLRRDLLAEILAAEGRQARPAGGRRIIGWSRPRGIRGVPMSRSLTDFGKPAGFGLQHEIETCFPPPVTDVETTAAPSLAHLPPSCAIARPALVLLRRGPSACCAVGCMSAEPSGRWRSGSAGHDERERSWAGGRR